MSADNRVRSSLLESRLCGVRCGVSFGADKAIALSGSCNVKSSAATGVGVAETIGEASVMGGRWPICKLGFRIDSCGRPASAAPRLPIAPDFLRLTIFSCTSTWSAGGNNGSAKEFVALLDALGLLYVWHTVPTVTELAVRGRARGGTVSTTSGRLRRASLIKAMSRWSPAVRRDTTPTSWRAFPSASEQYNSN